MKSKLFLFLERRTLLVLVILSLIYTLPSYNKYWAPCDEGIVTVAAQNILAGKIPYKDFFIIMYPPAQIYVLAVLFKFFSSPVIAARIYTVLISVGMSLLVFYMTRFLTKKNLFSAIAWFITLVSLAPRLGPIPAPIWPGVFFSLFTLYLYMLYLKDLKLNRMILTGIVAGIAILFRHDMGVFVSGAILITLVAGFLCRKNAFKDIIGFVGGILIAVLPCVAYLVYKSATKSMIDSLILFPFLYHKKAFLPFPAPCFNLNMIFHGSLHFIKVNQYYIPVLIYAFTSFYIVTEFFKKHFTKENFSILAILLFGIFSFSQVLMRTDPAHLLTVIAPSAVLFGFILWKAFSYKFSRKAGVFSWYVFSIFILVLFFLLSVKSMDKYFKNVFRKPYKKDIVATKFDVGTIYIPEDERESVVNTVNFIKENTKEGERIFLGNTAHWKDDFGGSIILYTLADRLPSTKYYEFAPGLVTDTNVHREIQNSLVEHDVKLIVLQDINLGSLRKEEVAKDKLVLDDFIEKHYKKAKKFGKYNILVRKGAFN